MKLKEKYKSLPKQKKTAVKILIALLVLLIVLIPLYFVADCSLKSTRFDSAKKFILLESNFKEYYGESQSFELEELKKEKYNNETCDVIYMKVNTQDGKVVSCRVVFDKKTVDGVKKEVPFWNTYADTTYADENKKLDFYEKAKAYIKAQENFEKLYGEISTIEVISLRCEALDIVTMEITIDSGEVIHCEVSFNGDEPYDWSAYPISK